MIRKTGVLNDRATRSEFFEESEPFMKQAVMTQPGKIEFRDVECPQPDADEVLLKIRRIGGCVVQIFMFTMGNIHILHIR